MRRTVLVGTLALLATPARAHPEWSPVRVNRYMKVVLGEKSRIVYTVLYGEGPGLPERKAVDANADGKLDATERDRLGARAAQLAAAGLQLTLDGRPLVLGAPAIDVGLAGQAVAPEPFSVDLSWPLAAGDGTHELMVDDRVVVANEGDSEVAVEASPPAELLSAERGAPSGKPGLEKVFNFRGPRFSALEDRRVTLRFQTKAAPLGGRLPYLWIGLGALVLAVGVTLAARYRSMKG